MPRRRLYSPAAQGEPQESHQRFGSPHTEFSTLLLRYCVTNSCPPLITVRGAVHHQPAHPLLEGAKHLQG